MMVIGAAITLGLLVGVALVMFAIKLPLQFAIWEAITAELERFLLVRSTQPWYFSCGRCHGPVLDGFADTGTA